MQTKILIFIVSLMTFFGIPTASLVAAPVGTTFIYQGKLAEGATAYTGNAEFRPTLWIAASNGQQVWSNTPPTVIVSVSNGLFELPLDFGAAPFSAGEERWLQLEVRTTIQPFTTLSPRQKLTPTHYALFALSAGTAATAATAAAMPWTGLTGLPASFADNVDNDTTYTAGTGLSLGGTAFSLDTGYTDGRYWKLGGNGGTTPGTHFLGTTDAAALVLRAGNQQVLRLEGDSTGPRIIGGFRTSVGAGSTNSAVLSGRESTIADSAHESVIVGGFDNIIGRDQRSAFIGGGARNEIRFDNQHAVIVGGRDNRIGTNSVITLVVGGGENHIGDNVDGGLMVGGFRNDILGSADSNRRAIAPVLIGGSDNEIGRGSSWSIILGGDNNRIGTNCGSAVILGGTNNLVADNCGSSLAAGRRARVNHPGAFVFADSQNASFGSSGVDTFNIRAQGGLFLSSDTEQFFGSTTRQMLNLWGTDYGIGVQSSTHYSRTSSAGTFSWFRGGIHSSSANTPGAGGVEMMRLNSGGLRVNGTFVSASDRNLKENFEPVNPQEMLAKVARLPLSQWNFKSDAQTTHLGPMAQDFHAAFGLGSDDKTIATVDADGVALAAIQGLNQKVEAENAALRAELKARDTELDSLKDRLEALEQKLSRLAAQ